MLLPLSSDVQVALIGFLALVGFIAFLVALAAISTMVKRKLYKEFGLLRRHLRYRPKPVSREFRLEE